MTHTTQLAHDALFYGTDDEFVAALRPFVRDGLAQGHAAVAAVSRPHRALLRDALGDDASTVIFIDSDEWYQRPAATVAGWRRLLADAAGRGQEQIRIIGEIQFGPEDRHPTWHRYESALNVLFADAPAWIVCPYDTRVLAPASLADARRTHPVVQGPDSPNGASYLAPEEFLRRVPEPLPAVADAPVTELLLGDDIAAARAAVARAAMVAGWQRGERLDDLVIVTSEVVTNAVRHGQGRRTLRVWISGPDVVCEVSDEGPGPADPLIGFRPPGDYLSGGMGLWITRQLCDLMGIDRSDGTTRVRYSLRP